jgi:hypothetical protein
MITNEVEVMKIDGEFYWACVCAECTKTGAVSAYGPFRSAADARLSIEAVMATIAAEDATRH